jgi:hypothetical protein
VPTEFEPRQITARDALVWFKETLGLILRRPHYFVLPVLPVLVFAYDWLGFFVLYPLYFLLVFTLQLCLSEVADTSSTLQPRRIWQQLKQCLMLNSGLFGGMLVLRAIVVALLLLGYTPPLAEQTNLSSGPTWMQNMNELSSLGMVLLIFLQFIHGWFRHALLVFQGLPAELSKHLSRKATLLNFYVIWQVAMGILLIHFLSFFAPLWVEFVIKTAILLWLPPYLYVAYRHIFLGKKDNAPVQVRQVVSAPAHSHG